MELRYTVLSDGTMSSTEWLMRNPDLATQWAVKMAETYLKIKGDKTQRVFLGGHRLWREATRTQHPPARSPRHPFARNHRRRNVSHRERRQSSRRPTPYINGIPIRSDIAVEKFPFLQEIVFLFKYLGVTV